MKRKILKKAVCLCIAAVAAMSMTACGSTEEEVTSEEVQEETELDENGNPIEKEEERTDKAILKDDSETMISGLLAVMEDGSITSNGVWLSENEVGSIAKQYAGTGYKYEKGSFKKSEVKYVANFYNINGDAVGAMYFNENMDMCYNNQYKITDPVMRGLFMEIKNSVKSDSVLESKIPEKGDNSGEVPAQTGMPADALPSETPASANATVEISTQAFADAGLEVGTAKVLAQSAFNLGIPVVKRAEIKENAIMFTDAGDKQYSIMIKDGKIYSVYNETDKTYVYQTN